ncbi:MAG: hypothetical protein ACK2UI_15265 [Anaerolineae bacterium]
MEVSFSGVNPRPTINGPNVSGEIQPPAASSILKNAKLPLAPHVEVF